jgi:hypothetical protein
MIITCVANLGSRCCHMSLPFCHAHMHALKLVAVTRLLGRVRCVQPVSCIVLVKSLGSTLGPSLGVPTVSTPKIVRRTFEGTDLPTQPIGRHPGDTRQIDLNRRRCPPTRPLVPSDLTRESFWPPPALPPALFKKLNGVACCLCRRSGLQT